MQIVYILYIDKIVLNKTKYLTLNTGAMGHKTLQFKNASYSLLSFNNKNIFTVNTQIKILKKPMHFSDFSDLQG